MHDLNVLDGTDANATENSTQYASLDDCIEESYADELFSLASLVRGRKKPKRIKAEHLKPMAFVRLNTRRGKPKPVTIRALIDSGAGGTMVAKRFVEKLKMKRDPKGTTTLSSPIL